MAIILQCRFCGNAYSKPPRNIGDICGVNKCTGTLAPHPRFFLASPRKPGLLLQCKTCGNVYEESAKRKIFATCGVGGCTGKLDRYWG